MSQHVADVKYQRAWGEYRPECMCGWIGSYWATNRQAQHEANLHVEGEDGYPYA